MTANEILAAAINAQIDARRAGTNRAMVKTAKEASILANQYAEVAGLARHAAFLVIAGGADLAMYGEIRVA